MPNGDQNRLPENREGGRPAGRMSFLEVEDAWKVKDRWIRVGIH